MPSRKIAAAIGLVLLCGPPALAETPPPDSPAARQEAEKLAKLPPVEQKGTTHPDPSGRKQAGRVSYYAHHFTNRKMADGNRFNPNGDAAASKTLPLGTTAKVTNVQNGKSATVKIEDRGPFVPGRVVDVTPKVADQLDIRKQGVSQVVVAPIAVPQPDGAVKLGAGAAPAEASPEEVAKATQETTAAAGR
ncbi:MAG: septal ring lytic transglycosylase RlpA family protein [Acetobacteraceae bacterium]|jgi:rare lipoprotein A